MLLHDEVRAVDQEATEKEVTCKEITSRLSLRRYTIVTVSRSLDHDYEALIVLSVMDEDVLWRG